jgi:SAM-dependent methyltransferase
MHHSRDEREQQMPEHMSGELYHDNLIGILERIWGDGWLSPGGPDEIARLFDGLSIKGKTVLDIGCGAGGVDLLLVETHGADYVCGIDVEDTVLATARQRAAKAGLRDRIGVMKVVPGPLPFPPQSFDVVFSKDSIIHIPDKQGLMLDVYRVLKPGGVFAASDWLIGHDHEPSPEMKAYIASEGLDFGMASPSQYRDAMEKAGFKDIAINSRNAWYRERARQELAMLTGPIYAEACASLGKDFVDHNVETWKKMIPVLDSGEHCPTHFRGFKL